MKVILNSDIDKVGRKGDIVTVADGFARNYLLPKNLAIMASRGAVRQSESMQRARTERDKREKHIYDELAAKIAGVSLKIMVRSGDEGQLFGSVTHADIADELSRALGQEFDKRKIVSSPIKSLGVHEYKVHLHPDVTAVATLEVVPDAASPPLKPKEEVVEPPAAELAEPEAPAEPAVSDEAMEPEAPTEQ